MNDPLYIYDVRGRETGLRVSVAIYDPERWAFARERGDRAPEDPIGGPRFGFDAEVMVSDDWQNPGHWRVEVSQGSSGFVPAAEAALRVDVYQQAVDIGRWLETLLVDGYSPKALAERLTTLFHPGEPLARPDVKELLPS